MTRPLLELTNLDVRYGGVQALRGISLSVYPGEIVTLIGANGAGKTTTLMATSSAVQVHAGTVCIDGADCTNSSPAEIVRRGVIHVPEGRRIFPRLTVRENLEMGAFLRRDSRAVRSDLRTVYTLFPRLEERAAQPGGTLSGGEQQMLALGRALLARPRLLLLDEPSLGLAPVIVQQVFAAIGNLVRSQGLTVLLVEQNATLALNTAVRGYVLETGKITLAGNSAELARNEGVQKAYLGV